MAQARSFPPLARGDARVLILGSMPGIASLRARQYYAHRQNQFWWIMGRLFGAERELPYAQRVERLLGRRVAVWDVLRHCEREGSLDSDIRPGSEVVNDFVRFLEEHSSIRAVFFNGRKSEGVFIRRVRAQLGPRGATLRYARLPSTSPAHAGVPRAAKLRAWRRIGEHL